ncbi:MAG: cellulase family glycosylhydrolase [Ignavibacteriales bacterium]|nr:MAG: cellulase family glycosylhydrolase [Ignavibacteriales bacterium]
MKSGYNVSIKFLVFAILIFTLILAFTGSSYPQGFLKASGKKIVKGNGDEILLRGIGLGGWLVPEGYMLQTSGFANSPTQIRNKIKALIGEANAETFWDLYYANYVNRLDINRIKEWGFNSIRLPMHYDLLTERNQPYVYIEEGFAQIDSLLSWCEANQLYLILDLHCAPGGQNAENISDYDPAYPSLWESDLNKQRTIALWKKLAERYVNKEWIGGYDLINETAWDLGTNNVPLRQLFIDITTAIREVDTNHIVFIEGNWFATDFSGLTPPWDNNMVYSFHKYWNENSPSAIGYLLNIRNTHNVPLWLGESGENSNQWFSDCISLMEANNIGWAWWPHKKIGSIADPLSAIKTNDYNYLLRYWNGQVSQPTLQFSVNALNTQAQKLHISQCVYQKDVIDAIFRLPHSSANLKFADNIVPGIINAVDYDMGRNNSAYSDVDYHNIQGNGGPAYNSGWSYRNDGVDIEASSHPFSNGFNIAFIQTGEYVNYTIDVQQSGLYDINIEYAANQSGGNMLLRMDGNNITNPLSLPVTGGWQNWSTLVVPDIWLPQGTHTFSVNFYFGGFNIAFYEFVLTVSDVEDESNTINEFKLEQNYPNPFNPTTKIQFTLPSVETGHAPSLHVTLKIFDVLGNEVATLVDGYKETGKHEVNFDASGLASGIYYYQLKAGSFIQTNKMMILK